MSETKNNDHAHQVGRPQTMVDGKRVNVYLDIKSIQVALKIGEGNLSSGIRKSLEFVAKNTCKL